jgi:hypothetical protein
MDQVADVMARIRSNLTGKPETVVPFVDPGPAKQKASAKTAARTTPKSSVNEGVSS